MSAPEPATPAQPAAASRGFAFGVGHLLGLLGGITVFVSLFLKWEDLTFHGRHDTSKAGDVPLQFLFDYTSKSKDPSLVLALAVSAALIVAGVLLAARVPAGRLLALLGGLLAVAIAVVYSFQVHQALNSIHVASQVSVTDFIGIAPYVTFVGGILALVGSVLPAPSQ